MTRHAFAPSITTLQLTKEMEQLALEISKNPNVLTARHNVGPCCLCGLQIQPSVFATAYQLGNSYLDGGPGKRAHSGCVLGVLEEAADR